MTAETRKWLKTFAVCIAKFLRYLCCECRVCISLQLCVFYHTGSKKHSEWVATTPIPSYWTTGSFSINNSKRCCAEHCYVAKMLDKMLLIASSVLLIVLLVIELPVCVSANFRRLLLSVFGFLCRKRLLSLSTYCVQFDGSGQRQLTALPFYPGSPGLSWFQCPILLYPGLRLFLAKIAKFILVW